MWGFRFWHQVLGTFWWADKLSKVEFKAQPMLRLQDCVSELAGDMQKDDDWWDVVSIAGDDDIYWDKGENEIEDLV